MFIVKQSDIVIFAADTEQECLDVVDTTFIKNATIEETEDTYIACTTPEGIIYLKEDDAKKAKRQELDNKTLTPADVERALVDALNMDFDDLIAFLDSKLTGINIKRIKAELRAKDFYRGALLGDKRLFDVIGTMLGYKPEDMDYLFENKKLPDKIITGK